MNQKESRLTIKEMALTAVMSAVLCVLAPLSLPIGPVPISLATLFVYISVYVLGTRLGTLSVVIYLLLGAVGLPVFSGYSGGIFKLAGPTGGYLIGYIPLAIISGIFVHRFAMKIVPSILGMIVGTAVLYALGTAWLAMSASMEFTAALAAGVIPFIPGDLVKIAVTAIVGPRLCAALSRAHVNSREEAPGRVD
ncbi:MAG: biotin transporter BioY [Eubacterium sp.]|nr:biotin transporter BioY [Eubacterium sp.]